MRTRDVSWISLSDACIAQGADYLHSGCMCRYIERERERYPGQRCDACDLY